MAADVDKIIPEDESNVSQRNGHLSPSSGSWIFRGIWTLLILAAVPLLAFGIKYYQDAQLLQRHVRSVITLHTSYKLISDANLKTTENNLKTA